jgi:TolB-like protein/class 3 adenylate cyclase/Tfp pilus assembly protein PilF
MTTTRRLAAILAADVAGYSRLMGADEEGTHERVKAHLAQLVEPKIAEYRGRIVKNTGDGFLAEFPSVVGAVRCAVEVQRGMIERNVETPSEKRIEFRVGINLGDVIVEEHDIFGDGVNVAARLEALAEPGGICISRTVRDHIGDRLPFAFEDLGEQSVKNIARSVRVYAWRPKAVADLPTVTAPRVTSVVAPRLSIVVLPFTNLSNDPEQQYFADGITEDLTTDLSRLAGMLVISRNTAFTYWNKPIDTKQIGRELGVRYVLEGSIRRSSSQVRVNAQLIDAETDAHLWADRFDSDISDLFTLQNEVTTRIANALQLELILAEAGRCTEHCDVLDYVFRGRSVYWRPVTADSHAEAIGWYERALAVDPRSVEALSSLATSLAGRVLDGMTDTPAADIQRAVELAKSALAVSPRNPRAHFARGQLLRAQGRYEEATIEYEMAIALNRNWVLVIAALGWCKFLTGSTADALLLHEQAIRLSPRDPGIGNWYDRIGRIHLLQSRTNQAIGWLEKARGANPAHPGIRIDLAAAYALEDNAQLAAAELAEARRLSGGHRFSSIAHLKALPGTWGGVPKIRALFEATYFPALRKAGMLEE